MNPTNRTPVLRPVDDSDKLVLYPVTKGASENVLLTTPPPPNTTQNTPDASEIPCRNPLKKCDGMAKYVMQYGSGSAYQCPKCFWVSLAGGGK